jgi:hypothetical protein
MLHSDDDKIDEVPEDSKEQEGQLFSDADKKTTMFHITKHMARRPILICTSVFAFILFIVVLTLTTITMFSPTSKYDWIIGDTEQSKFRDALDDAINKVDSISTSNLVGERRQFGQSFSFVFKSKDGDLFTAANVQSMCMSESQLVKNEKFEDFCMLNAMDKCNLNMGLSIPMYFYGFTSVEDWYCTLLDETTVAAKRDSIYAAMNTSDGLEMWGSLLDKGAAERGYSMAGASHWILGAPLKGYVSTSDRAGKQLEAYKNFLGTTGGGVGGVEESLFTFFNMDSNADGIFAYYPSAYLEKASHGGLDVLWNSVSLYAIENDRVITTDISFTVFALVFVFMWLRVHTGNTFVSAMGMYMIIMALPFGIFMYKVLYQVPYFASVHILVIFIVLGVGADDVLVLVDSWEKTRTDYPATITNGKNRDIIHRRLYECYGHTVSTVFNTSLTTACAFVATGLSPLMPIATLGWFAATCIVVSYLFVITMMPPVVVIAECYFSHWVPFSDPKAIQYSPAKESSQEPLPLAGEENIAEEGKGEGILTLKHMDGNGGAEMMELGEQNTNGLKIDDPNTVDTRTIKGQAYLPMISAGSDDGVKGEGQSESDTPMVDVYLKFMEISVDMPLLGKMWPIYYVSWVLLLCLLVYGIVGASYGLALQPPTEPEAWFAPHHMYVRYGTEADKIGGGKNEDYEKAVLAFGIAGVDRSGFDPYKPDYRGTVVFDDGFNMAAPSCQKAFVKMCIALPEYECGGINGACEVDDKLVRTNTSECFMTSYRTWAQSTYGQDTYNMNESTFYATLTEFRNTQTQEFEVNSYQKEIGFIGGDLKFVSLPFIAAFAPKSSIDVKEGVSNVLKRFVRDVKAYPECKECDCSSLMFTSDFALIWLSSEKGLVAGFYQGLYIAFPVSFLVLLYATGNIMITIYAMLTLFFIVFSVLGFLAYGMGWSLGIAESIAGIIIIGFSVDYTVHLGHMYNHASHEGIQDRKSKVEYASRKITGTIIGGAITTAGAGSIMFACQLMFFQKMGVLIVATIVLSVVYSLFFFMSILLCFGPEGEHGNMLALSTLVRTYAENLFKYLFFKGSLKEEANEGDAEAYSSLSKKSSCVRTVGSISFEVEVEVEGKQYIEDKQ